MILEKPETFSPSCIPPKRKLEEALWFIFKGNEILVTANAKNAVSIPTYRQVIAAGIETASSHFIGQLEKKHCFAAEVLDTCKIPSSFSWRGLRAIFNGVDDSIFAIAGRCYQIIDWDRTNKFCGRCGSATFIEEHERVKICLQCNQKHYPRIAPAVMALISRDEEFLLARSPHFPLGMFSALAGFSEPGETLEQTVHREVFEEVGIKVSNITYFASQPWPFPHSMMIAFHCKYLEGDINCDPDEIEDAKWFNATNLPPRLPGEISIARQLVNSKLNEIER